MFKRMNPTSHPSSMYRQLEQSLSPFVQLFRQPDPSAQLPPSLVAVEKYGQGVRGDVQVSLSDAQFQFLSAHRTTGGGLQLEWPYYFGLNFNHRYVQKKQTDLCVDVTDLHVMQVNSVGFTFTSQHVYTLVFFLAYKYSDAQLIRGLQYTIPSFDAELERVKRFFSAGDDDDLISDQVVKLSLRCPLSQLRILNPIRSSSCSHLGSWDAGTFLSMIAVKRKWQCPYCFQEVPWTTIYMDPYVLQILEETNDGVDTVFVHQDGTWSTSLATASHPSTTQRTRTGNSDSSTTTTTASSSNSSRSVITIPDDYYVPDAVRLVHPYNQAVDYALAARQLKERMDTLRSLEMSLQQQLTGLKRKYNVFFNEDGLLQNVAPVKLERQRQAEREKDARINKHSAAANSTGRGAAGAAGGGVPEPIECPVCMRKFPLGTADSFIEFHVNDCLSRQGFPSQS